MGRRSPPAQRADEFEVAVVNARRQVVHGRRQEGRRKGWHLRVSVAEVGQRSPGRPVPLWLLHHAILHLRWKQGYQTEARHCGEETLEVKILNRTCQCL